MDHRLIPQFLLAGQGRVSAINAQDLDTDYCLGANGRSKQRYKEKVFYFSETDSGIHYFIPHLIEHGILRH